MKAIARMSYMVKRIDNLNIFLLITVLKQELNTLYNRPKTEEAEKNLTNVIIKKWEIYS